MTLSVLRLYLAARVLKRVGVDAESDAWVIADLDEPHVLPRRGSSVCHGTESSRVGHRVAEHPVMPLWACDRADEGASADCIEPRVRESSTVLAPASDSVDLPGCTPSAPASGQARVGIPISGNQNQTLDKLLTWLVKTPTLADEGPSSRSCMQYVSAASCFGLAVCGFHSRLGRTDGGQDVFRHHVVREACGGCA